MRRIGYFMATWSLLFVSTSWSQGINLRIEIAGDGIAETIVISDPATLGLFNIWNGPGATIRGPDDTPVAPAHVDPDPSQGRFVDWPKGIVRERPSGLQRVEVTFIIGFRGRSDDERPYVIAYEVDTKTLDGFIYLPLWMNSLIAHRVEGNWFHATERWNEVIAPIIENHTGELPVPADRERIGCRAGQAVLEPDGTIDLKRFDSEGRNVLHYRYDRSSDYYPNVRAHIGNMIPGETVEVSCWPPRR